MTDALQVPIDSDWEYEFDAKRKNAATGNTEVAAALTGVTAYFTLTIGGDALGATTVSLTERASTPGRYAGICDGAVMTTALAGYVGRLGYQVFNVSGDRITHERVQFVASLPPS